MADSFSAHLCHLPVDVLSPATITAATILLGQTPPHTLRQLAWKVALEYVAVMLVAIWIGNYLLMALGLNAHALTATGGAALLFQGWPLMTKGTKAEPARMVVTPDARPNVQDMVLVPLLFPLTIGGEPSPSAFRWPAMTALWRACCSCRR